jgi:SH3-like domain-containing protein
LKNFPKQSAFFYIANLLGVLLYDAKEQRDKSCQIQDSCEKLVTALIRKHLFINFLNFIIFSIFFISGIEASIKSCVCDPYYASIKSNKANSHFGPGQEYKIRFVYIQKGTPVMIVAKYDCWRKIKDAGGFESWIHKSLLSTKRFVITISDEPSKLISNLNDSSTLVAVVEKGVIMELLSMRGKWCRVRLADNGNYNGWIMKKNVFGAFDNESW